ncbi:tRNA(fMet)-specific endonuclease VapC [Pseudovibrio sp. Tun.PSC04-5.I4]|uniref:type II toxin-antitoxin system tRNA(fMet)-specific endonuclease VapC n=1 Tax=Pseudovibrio sp. Tun.PSC04-5.I4 TaxID=1798213 RepID=UPI00089218DE|nr:tRNA(fMet)-specific endonuclease VapC [Pseudovibrio sp. Tun.PSC04-5.I4]SDQ13746.1 tRNA(fMet)-specific endonuclease VapC [Pseudovibrio sp. Tun.PSC04-5.I4]
MLKYMLDTNICIFTIKNRPEEVRKQFETYSNQMAVSTVTTMELIYGAEKSAKPAENLSVIEGFLARLNVLNYDHDAAGQTGQLRAELAKKGQPIGPYDMMIAGHARALGLILVTNNTREFNRAPGLRVEDWVNHH